MSNDEHVNESAAQAAKTDKESQLHYLDFRWDKNGQLPVDNESDDREGLESGRLGPFKGYVELISGDSSQACPMYAVTRHELFQLLGYWYQCILDQQMWTFYTGDVGSGSCRRVAYASRRVERIARIIGREAYHAVITQVEKKYRQAMGPDWTVFVTGSEEDRWRVRDEIGRERRRPDLPEFISYEG